MRFVLIDLERSIGSGNTFYWKSNRRGYTRNPVEVGYYSQQEAEEHVLNDLSINTVMVSEEKLKDILKKAGEID